MEPPSTIHSLEIKRQHKNIDVLVIVNGSVAICIEDKVWTTEHSDQLARYILSLKEDGFDEDDIVPVYIQTGEQSSYKSVKAAGFSVVRRNDIRGRRKKR